MERRGARGEGAHPGSAAAAFLGSGTVSGRVVVTRRLTPAGSWSLMRSMCPSCSSGTFLRVMSRLYVWNWKASKCLWYLNGDLSSAKRLTFVGIRTSDARTPRISLA